MSVLVMLVVGSDNIDCNNSSQDRQFGNFTL